MELHEIYIAGAAEQLGTSEREVLAELEREPTWGILPKHQVVSRWMQRRGVKFGLPNKLDTAPGKFLLRPEGEPVPLVQLRQGNFQFTKGTIIGLRDVHVYKVCGRCRVAMKDGKCPACESGNGLDNLKLEFTLADEDGEVIARSQVREVSEALLGMTTEEIIEMRSSIEKELGRGQESHVAATLVYRLSHLLFGRTILASGNVKRTYTKEGKPMGATLYIFWFEDADLALERKRVMRELRATSLEELGLPSGMLALYRKLAE